MRFVAFALREGNHIPKVSCCFFIRNKRSWSNCAEAEVCNYCKLRSVWDYKRDLEAQTRREYFKKVKLFPSKFFKVNIKAMIKFLLRHRLWYFRLIFGGRPIRISTETLAILSEILSWFSSVFAQIYVWIVSQIKPLAPNYTYPINSRLEAETLKYKWADLCCTEFQQNVWFNL
jgi:hypothetical protein